MNKENELQYYLSVSPNKYGIYLFDTKNLTNLYKEEIILHNDTNYQNYRAKIQNPKMKKRILKLPLFIRQLLARIMRKKSQHESNQISQDNMKKFDVNLTDLVNYCNKHQVKTVIHGHTHLPGIDLINQLTTKDYQYRFVLSDWHKTGHYLEMKTGCPPTLHHFS